MSVGGDQGTDSAPLPRKDPGQRKPHLPVSPPPAAASSPSSTHPFHQALLVLNPFPVKECHTTTSTTTSPF